MHVLSFQSCANKVDEEEVMVKSQVLRFQTEDAIKLDEDPLQWWRKRAILYSSLVPLAKKYMSIPATSVASERLFSTAGDVVTASRSLLSPEHVDQILFIKKNV